MKKLLGSRNQPSILAPAGTKSSFLAALAAGADSIYCGLKQFSARMEAANFTLSELIPLIQLAHEMKSKVFVTLNTLIKPDEIKKISTILKQLVQKGKPDGLIIQDLSLIQIARQVGFSGEMHLSTLSNMSLASSLKLVKENIQIDKVVVPRELTIDEIKTLASACPKNLSLEIFVHGALCYGVSGRCYWSSYLGGKSSVRGRCVQPCRRLYSQGQNNKRFFSCQDLSIDVLVKVLLSIPQVSTWKIEGRKKGPHYVFHTVNAYRILRDGAGDPQKKREALEFLSQSLGRPGTHYYFLPQRLQNPINTDTQTGSGFLLGYVKGTRKKPFFSPNQELIAGDTLRIGYEDGLWHTVLTINKSIPKRGRYYLKSAGNKQFGKNTPVFLTDRREKLLNDILQNLQRKVPQIAPLPPPSPFKTRMPKRKRTGNKQKTIEMNVVRIYQPGNQNQKIGVWLFEETVKKMHRKNLSDLWWWLPPVTWPKEEDDLKELIGMAADLRGQNFILNSPWQISLFKNFKHMNLWAGPFCNIANALAIKTLSSMGFSGCYVSPELGGTDYFALPKHSPLPLGIVLHGNWPFCVSRALSDGIKTENPFTSPKGEKAWIKKYGLNYWVYPDWQIDIRSKKKQLEKAGYIHFANIIEPLPKNVKLKRRPGLWNWEHGLK